MSYRIASSTHRVHLTALIVCRQTRLDYCKLLECTPWHNIAPALAAFCGICTGSRQSRNCLSPDEQAGAKKTQHCTSRCFSYLKSKCHARELLASATGQPLSVCSSAFKDSLRLIISLYFYMCRLAG